MANKYGITDIDDSLYDFRYDEDDFFRIKEGLTPEIVEQISKEKGDPDWMREFRLRSLALYYRQDVPNWGPSIEGLNMDEIATYVRPNTDMKNDWDSVPQDIKDTFDKLGIPRRSALRSPASAPSTIRSSSITT